ncbi:MBL fold metallo-hydrolase [Rhodococcus sp. T7]|uniref:MBL fold metallo-hydrolase n=1 Tax=Rhodococcus sp. T7 TaxID=627444 RepID=UPI00135B60F8|nr:MBL fold metallo-hydrolase [Rhodococcus sp. T7]KAF0965133.1 putative metallo-hydrolase [Rhodococcus sp. T7]
MTINKVHHLNCGTFASLLVGTLVSHVLLCETSDGLVLVDSGIGILDIESPRRLGRAALLLRPRLRREETAAYQVAALGYSTSDIRHIVATHLDYDHIGGASDFPAARVHTTAVELRTARTQRSLPDRFRYRRSHVEALTHIETYDGVGEKLLGFTGAHPINGVRDMWLVPLPGHTAGHAGVALRVGGRRWLFHAGDAFFDHHAIGPTDQPRTLRIRKVSAMEGLLAAEHNKVERNHARLRDLAHTKSASVSVFCSHDPVMLGELQRCAQGSLPGC